MHTDLDTDISTRPAAVDLSTIRRRTLLVGVAGAGVAGLSGMAGRTAEAVTARVQGGIATTYTQAGGAAVFGRPLSAEQLRVVNGQRTWGQRFERGQVWWSAGKGRYDLPGGRRVRLSKGPNFRPVKGVRGVYRTDDLDGATALDERIVTDLGITKMIAFNSGGDPSISGVKKYTYVISNSGSHLTFYRNYVRTSTARAQIGKAMKVIAASSKPVLIHCKAGKDRTGWTSDLLQSVAGVSTATRNADYLATRKYSGDHVELDWLEAARDEIAVRYGSVERYLTQGCGLSARQLRALRSRLG